MKNNGWIISGVEVNKAAREIAETNTGSNIMNQKDFFKSEQKYDVITLWHSLEHLYDLKQYLQKISISLNANGVIIIAVPNYNSYDAVYYKQDWAAYDTPRHLYHFSFKAIEVLFNEYGYKITNYKQMPFDPFYVSLLSEMSVRKKHNIIKALWIGWKSYLKGRIYANRGSSVLYVFKKL